MGEGLRSGTARALAGAVVSLGSFLALEMAAPYVVSAGGPEGGAGPGLAEEWLPLLVAGAFVVSLAGSSVAFVARVQHTPWRAALPLLVNAATILWLMLVG
jgi:hypothetical protein